jgi:hypothetical protein
VFFYNLIRNRYQNEMKIFRSFILEDQAHMAEGFALALDLFEDLENRRRGNKSVLLFDEFNFLRYNVNFVFI